MQYLKRIFAKVNGYQSQSHLKHCDKNPNQKRIAPCASWITNRRRCCLTCLYHKAVVRYTACRTNNFTDRYTAGTIYGICRMPQVWWIAKYTAHPDGAITQILLMVFYRTYISATQSMLWHSRSWLANHPDMRNASQMLTLSQTLIWLIWLIWFLFRSAPLPANLIWEKDDVNGCDVIPTLHYIAPHSDVTT